LDDAIAAQKRTHLSPFNGRTLTVEFVQGRGVGGDDGGRWVVSLQRDLASNQHRHFTHNLVQPTCDPDRGGDRGGPEGRPRERSRSPPRRRTSPAYDRSRGDRNRDGGASPPRRREPSPPRRVRASPPRRERSRSRDRMDRDGPPRGRTRSLSPR
jgi:hypothetical protein